MLISYLFKNLKGTDWELLTDFVSPVFFEVVPTLGMSKVFGVILKDCANRKEFNEVLRCVAATLSSRVNLSRGCMVEIADQSGGATTIAGWSLSERQSYGAMVLRIYFAQIFAAHKSVLDLRASAFSGHWVWSPKPVFYGWSDDFREGLQSLYRGFYQGDETLFKAGLQKLNLTHAEAAIRGHFGDGHQNSVTFFLDNLKKSLHAVFVSCKEHNVRLHPDFFALGVYLLCLYENLESLSCPLDVRAAFLEAVNP